MRITHVMNSQVFKVTGPDHDEAASTLSVKSTEADAVLWKARPNKGGVEVDVQLSFPVHWQNIDRATDIQRAAKEADIQRATKEAEQAVAKAVSSSSSSTANAVQGQMPKRFEEVVRGELGGIGPSAKYSDFEDWAQYAKAQGELPKELLKATAAENVGKWANATQERVEQVRASATDVLGDELSDDHDQTVLAIAKTMLAKAAGPVQMKLEALRVASLSEEQRMYEDVTHNPFEGISEEKLSEMIDHNFATVTKTKREQLKGLARKARELKSGVKEVADAPEGLKALLITVGRQAKRLYLGEDVDFTSWSRLFGSLARASLSKAYTDLEPTRKKERERGLRRSYTNLRDEGLAMLGAEGLTKWVKEKLPKDTPREVKGLLLSLAFQIGEKGRPFFEKHCYAGKEMWMPIGVKDETANLKDLVELLVAQAADAAGPWSTTSTSNGAPGNGKSTEAASVDWKSALSIDGFTASVQLPTTVAWFVDPYKTNSADTQRATKKAEQALAKAVSPSSSSTASVVPDQMPKRFEEVVLRELGGIAPSAKYSTFEDWAQYAEAHGDLPKEYRDLKNRETLREWTNATQERVEQLREKAADVLAKELPDDHDQVVLAIAETMLAKAAGPVQMKLEALRVASLSEKQRMYEAEAYDTCGCFPPFEGLSEEHLDEMIDQNFATVTKRDDLKALARQARKFTKDAWVGGQVSGFLKSGDKNVADAPEGLKALLVRVGRQAERFYLGKLVDFTSWSRLFGSRDARFYVGGADLELGYTREEEKKRGLRVTYLRDEALAMLGGEGLKNWVKEKLPKDTPREMKELLPGLAFQIGEKGRPFFEKQFSAGVPAWMNVTDQTANVKVLMERLVAQAADSAGPWSDRFRPANGAQARPNTPHLRAPRGWKSASQAYGTPEGEDNTQEDPQQVPGASDDTGREDGNGAHPPAATSTTAAPEEKPKEHSGENPDHAEPEPEEGGEGDADAGTGKPQKQSKTTLFPILGAAGGSSWSSS